MVNTVVRLLVVSLLLSSCSEDAQNSLRRTRNNYKISGTVSGLSGTVVLQKNSADSVSVTANGQTDYWSSLASGVSYVVTILSAPWAQRCSLANASGTLSSASITNVDLTCTNKSWTYPTAAGDAISPTGGASSSVSVATDSSGNKIIVWAADGTGVSQIYKSEYRNGSWTHPTGINDNISPNTAAENPKVAMDDNGNAIIIWEQTNGTNKQIFKSEYRSGSWTHPSGVNDNISPDGQDTMISMVAMDNNGNAIIAWTQSDGTNNQIFKSEYRSGSWSHPANLTDNISPNGQDAGLNGLAMDNNGNALIVWTQSDGTDNQIFKSEYRSGSWAHPANVADNISPGSTFAGVGDVAMDDDGNAIIVWEQSNGSVEQIFKSEYRNGSWTHPSGVNDNISPDNTDAYYPQVAMDNNGNAIITWDQFDNVSAEQIFISEYRSGAWDHPTGLTDNISQNGYDGGEPQVVMDDNGNAFVLWEQRDAGAVGHIYKSEYRSGSWTHPTAATDHFTPNIGDAADPSFATSTYGDVIIGYTQHDGTSVKIFMANYR